VPLAAKAFPSVGANSLFWKSVHTCQKDCAFGLLKLGRFVAGYLLPPNS